MNDLELAAVKFGYSNFAPNVALNDVDEWLTNALSGFHGADKVAALTIAQGVANAYAIELAKREICKTT